MVKRADLMLHVTTIKKKRKEKKNETQEHLVLGFNKKEKQKIEGREILGFWGEARLGDQ